MTKQLEYSSHELANQGQNKSEAEKVIIVNEPDSYKEAARRIFNISGPFATNRILSIGAENIGRLMLSQLGPNYLAACGTYAALYTLVIITSATTIYVTPALIGKEIKSNNKENVGRVVNTSMSYSFTLGVINSLVLAFSAYPLEWLGQNKDVATITQQMFRANCVGIVMNLMSVTYQQTCYTLEHGKIPLGTNILRRLTYLGLAYLLIFGGLGIPALNEYGFGLAQTFSTALEMILFTLYFAFSKLGREHNILRTIQLSWDNFKSFLKEGAFYGGQSLSVFLSGFLNTIFAGIMGDDELASWEINNQYFSLFSIPMLAISHAVFTLFKKTDKTNVSFLNKIEKMGYLICGAFPIFASTCLVSIPKVLTYPFIMQYPEDTANNIMDITKPLLRSSATIVPFTAVSAMLSGVIRAKGYTMLPTIFSFISLILIGLTFGAILSYVTGLGPIGLNFGVLLGSGIASLLFLGARGYDFIANSLNNNNAQGKSNNLLVNSKGNRYNSFQQNSINNSDKPDEDENDEHQQQRVMELA